MKGDNEDALAIIEHVMKLAPPKSVEWKRKFVELRKKCR